MKSIIFTDGASRGNPGLGGWGAIIATGDDNSKFQNPNVKIREIGGKEENTTNNRMEMTAAIESLRKITSNSEIELYTDSAYLINGITKWVFGWQKNNWQSKTKKEILNKDLWQELLKVSHGKKIKWNRLSGHSGIPANERCDTIATSFADGKPIKIFNGPMNGYRIDLSVTESKADASGQLHDLSKRLVKKSPAYSYISEINGKIKVHKTWEECEARVKGKSGARFKKSVSENNEKEIIAEFSA